jgi:hypothetical protein
MRLSIFLLALSGAVSYVANQHKPAVEFSAEVEETTFITSQEHGPDAKCEQWCAPGGHEDHVSPPNGIKVVACGNSRTDGCQTENGKQCSEEHRVGCTEFCRTQCCSCCSI